MNAYDAIADLYGYGELDGKGAYLEYLPTERSRTWRRGFFVKSYSDAAYQNAVAIKAQNNWHSIRFVGA